jgi:hypothetical protein
MRQNEALVTTNKNRYRPGEQIIATLRMEGSFTGANISNILIYPNGKTVTIEPAKAEHNGFCLYAEADSSGLYTLVCAISNNTDTQHICSTCFFVGDCEAAIPKAPAAPVLLVPEMWEEPDHYKLISFYLMSDGKPVPNKPVMLIFRNKSGRMTKDLSTDGTGNVFFSPYMAGTYSLISKVSFEYGTEVKIEGMAIAIFSFIMPELNGKRIGTKKRKYSDL